MKSVLLAVTHLMVAFGQILVVVITPIMAAIFDSPVRHYMLYASISTTEALKYIMCEPVIHTHRLLRAAAVVLRDSWFSFLLRF